MKRSKLLDPRPIVVVLLFLTASNQGQVTKSEGSMPEWLKVHMSYMTNGTGRWIADNSAFKNEDEPYDEYGTEWKWGIGKQSIRGRLFAVREKQVVADFWEFRLFWHPSERKAILEQFGGNGIVGVGEMKTVGSKAKSERISEMTFYNPDGKTWKDLHKIIESRDEHSTTSFSFKDGIWQKQRNYVWKRDVQ